MYIELLANRTGSVPNSNKSLEPNFHLLPARRTVHVHVRAALSGREGARVWGYGPETARWGGVGAGGMG